MYHLSGYPQKAVLRDGKEIIIRPICTEDKDALLKFHSRLSDETKFLRYHYSKGELTQSDLDNFCNIDYSNSMALVAEIIINGQKNIIGIGRYNRLPYNHTAEVAFVLQDSEQNKGIGTILLEHLSKLALQNSIQYFVGEVFKTNARMLSIFRKSDPGLDLKPDDHSTCSVKLSISKN
jgi:RimJ/RimL family protein N-acetyltransferase